jgi:cation/acetate symporter
VNLIPLFFVVLVTLATVILGIVATRKSKSVSDAGRAVGVLMNASAISGEYLSAASFMGIAGLVMKNGYDALWYPVGYAAGYLFLLLFIAGPLRRFGAYTIPDFAHGRFDSPEFRRIAVAFVLFIGFFYTMPQMKAAGVTMNTILGWPYWVGIVVVGTVITFNVAIGGMKGITMVQAFQYWAKVFAISVPLFVVMSVTGGYTHLLGQAASLPSDIPRLSLNAAMAVKGKAGAPSNVLTFNSMEPVTLTFPDGADIAKISTARKPGEGETPIKPSDLVQVVGGGAPVTSEVSFPPGTVIKVVPVVVKKNGVVQRVGPMRLRTSAKIEFASLTNVVINPAIGPISKLKHGVIAPNAPTNKAWLNPFGPFTSKWGYPLLTTYSLIIALVCGTAGLPHILVRFYTNPDGKSAKRTTLWVMVLLGLFYVFTPMWGTLGRFAMPSLYVTGATDSAVIRLPMLLSDKTLGEILSGVTSAGAFAAFMSTFSGLLVSMAGAFAHDIYGKILRPHSSPEHRLRAFKIAAVAVGAISMGLGMLAEPFDIAMMVGWAFAIGAASYFPLLLLGSWWRGLTKTGAAAGMLIGGLLSLAAIVGHMLLDKKVIGIELPPLVRALMEQPAIWGVPLSLSIMWIVSKMTAKTVPPDIDLKMLRLHAPEALGWSKNYIES